MTNQDFWAIFISGVILGFVIGFSIEYVFAEPSYDYTISVRVEPDSEWNYTLCWHDKDKGAGCEVVVTDESLIEKYKEKANRFLKEYKK